MSKQRLRFKQVRSVWGMVGMPVQYNHCSNCGVYSKSYTELGMDNSGFLPNALEKAIDLTVRMGFREAALVASKWGLPIGKSTLESVVGKYAKVAYEEGKKRYGSLAEQPLRSCKEKGNKIPPRRWIIQADGTYVMEKDKGGKGLGEGREVKSLIAYPVSTPSERVSLSAAIEIEEFRPLAHGLPRQANIRQEDKCLGLGDGAGWVVDLLTELGCEKVLLDVYHAVDYLDEVFKELGLAEEERLEERKNWLKGKVDGKEYLKGLRKDLELSVEPKAAWSDKGKVAWKYLHKQAERGALEYIKYKEAGWDIGSGQIEGYNKWAIGQRMKGSGMRWTKSGLQRMAFLRSEFASAKPVTSFHAIRFLAFPTMTPVRKVIH